MRSHRSTRMAIAAGAAAIALGATGCSGGSGDDDGSVELSIYIDSTESSVAIFDGIIEAYKEVEPDVTITTETHPAGGEGDNLVKTRLATGEMNDLFFYNSGSLFQALNPDQTLVDVSDEDWTGSLLDEFMANNDAIEAAGIVPIAQTYGDTWTSQLFVLGDFYNVLADDPDWAEKYTDNEAKFADEPGLAGFEHQQEAFDAGYFNEDFASATYDDGVRMIAEGTAAHYPMLTGNVASAIGANYPDASDTVGVFPLPSDDASNNGLTVWMPNGLYIPKGTEGAQLEAAKDLLAWIASPDGCDAVGASSTLGGPYVVDGCELPDDVPAIVSDMQPYFDDGKTGLALEFLSPIKGPALEQITVEVGSGIRDAQDGAALYDEDVKKQAQQLGLDGW
jgi:raffinose/stachyose/melibiose transport system substrate-binding protein